MKALPRVAALGAALLLAVLYALFASSDPSAAFAAFFIGPFSNAYSMNALLESAAPLLACALGACIAFRAGSFNLGGEGQAAVGTLAAALAGSALGGHSGLPAMAGIAVVMLAAAAAGSALALVSAVAERRTGAQVMLTSFLFAEGTFHFQHRGAHIGVKFRRLTGLFLQGLRPAQGDQIFDLPHG